MNKKIIALVSVAVIPAMLFIAVIEWAIGRLLPYGQSHYLALKTMDAAATLLALPVRLYAFFIYGDRGSWSLPILILLLAMSCLMWGVIVERSVWLFSKRSTAR
jgi:hypothetical protein